MQNGNGWLRFLERSELLEQWLRLLSVHVHGLLPPVVAPCSATEVLAHGLMATQQNRAGGLSWAARRTRATRQAADWPTTTTLGPCQSVGFPLSSPRRCRPPLRRHSLLPPAPLSAPNSRLDPSSDLSSLGFVLFFLVPLPPQVLPFGEVRLFFRPPSLVILPHFFHELVFWTLGCPPRRGAGRRRMEGPPIALFDSLKVRIATALYFNWVAAFRRSHCVLLGVQIVFVPTSVPLRMCGSNACCFAGMSFGWCRWILITVLLLWLKLILLELIAPTQCSMLKMNTDLRVALCLCCYLCFAILYK